MSNNDRRNLNPDGLHGYRKNLGSYFAGTAAFVVPGIVLGIAVDRICAKLQASTNFSTIVIIIIQLVVMVIVLYVIEMGISIRYSDAWQGNTPGLFFVSFFFGVQFNLFTNIGLLSSKVLA